MQKGGKMGRNHGRIEGRCTYKDTEERKRKMRGARKMAGKDGRVYTVNPGLFPCTFVSLI